MSDRATAPTVVLLVLLVAGCGFAAASLSPGTPALASADLSPPVDPGVEPHIEAGPTSTPIQPCAADPPPDFSPPDRGNAAIGWVDGYWYSQPLAVSVDDGFNDTERGAVVARTTARIEAMRCLAAIDGAPPIEVVTPEEFRTSRSPHAGGEVSDRRNFDDARLSTLLMAGTETDAAEERDATRAVTVRGTYNYATGNVTIVRSDDRGVGLDETVLAHELAHAIQDQQFDLGRYDRATTDRETALLGLVEGDVHRVAQRYREACAADRWDEPCLTDPGDGDETAEPDDGADPENWGLYLMHFLPYNDGPRFVDHLSATGGWDAVDAAYEDPPGTAVSVVDPARYPDPPRGDVSLPDESSDVYERVPLAADQPFDTVGVAAIAATFMTPGFESEWSETIYRPREILNLEDGETVDRSRPLNYDQPVVEGWRDDKLSVYRHRETGDLGTVWRLQFSGERASSRFVDRYRELIDYRDGAPVTGLEHTYTFEENDAYEMAVRVDRDGDTVTVVTAPTVPDLAAVHRPATAGT